MADESELVFYDIASNQPDLCHNPSTWKIRFTLNYKRIPYKTEWLEFPEIEHKSKSLGIPTARTKPDGSPFHTLPAIWDPRTESGVSESYPIAQYLDKAYPDTPLVLFDGIEEFNQAIHGSGVIPELKSLIQFVVPSVPRFLNPASQEYYVRTREEFFGKKWEDIMPRGKEREDAWKEIKKGFDILDRLLQKNGGPFARGDQISFVDLSFGGFLYSIRMLWGEDSELWQDLLTWNDGRWGKFVERLAVYAKPLTAYVEDT